MNNKEIDKYRKIFDEALDMLFVAEAETGIIIDCNKAAAKTLGWRKEELIGRHQRSIHPEEEHVGNFSRTFKQHITDKNNQMLEAKVVTQNGELLDVDIKASTLEINGEKVIVAIFREKTLEQKYQQEINDLARFPSENPSPVMRATSSGITLYINKAGQEQLREWHIEKGKPMPHFFQQTIHNVYRKQKTQLKEFKAGDTFFQFTFTPIRGEHYINIYAMDITHKKKAEKELRRSEELHRTIGEKIPFGSWTADAEGRCLSVTKPFLDMTGMTFAEIKNFGWLDRVPEEEREELRTNWLHCVKNCMDWEYQYRLRGANGSLYTLHTIGRPVYDKKGQISYWAGFHFDVTKQKKVERQLFKLNARLEDIVEERTRHLLKTMKQLRKLAFELTVTEQRERHRLADILHNDLQQLMVAGKLKIERMYNRSADEKSKKDLKEVLRLLEQSSRTTRNISSELRPSGNDYTDLVESINWLCEWFRSHFDFTVHKRIPQNFVPDTLPKEITVFLFEAIRELIFNVVKHGGMSSAELFLDIDPENYLHITLCDQGRGTDTNVLAKNVDNFDKGSGLMGMRERLSFLGGTLNVTSAQGEGFIASITIPYDFSEDASADKVRHEDARSPSPPIPPDFQKPSPIKILVADDHPPVQQGLKALLSGEDDMECIGLANNGRDAVAMAMKLRPDVIIMDVRLPEMNGIEATRQIIADNQDISIIGLTANADQATIRAMFRSGAAACLDKGDSNQILIDTIRSSQNKD
ncbi:MAG: PAS domain S-box protein [Desulfobulbaceae bacterium]|nr:PAS domain S-box protein [Desulfobulbaceae bacterium]